MKIRPNIYNSHSICIACGFRVIGKRGGFRIACSIETEPGKKPQRSECQVYSDRLRQQESRAKMQKEHKRPEPIEAEENTNLKLRECLGRLCIDLEPSERLFMSSSKHNRQCSRCGGVNQQEGIPIREIKFKGGVVEHGVVRTFVPGQVSRSRNKD